MNITQEIKKMYRECIERSPQRVIDGVQCYLFAKPRVNRDLTVTELWLSVPAVGKRTKGFIRITRPVSHKDYVEVSCKFATAEEWNSVWLTS